jgi:hypothetical protein
MVTMSKKRFIREHVKLIKILRYGNRRSLLKEATSQSKELRRYKK